MEKHLQKIKHASENNKLVILVGSTLTHNNAWSLLREEALSYLEKWKTIQSYIPEIKERHTPNEAFFRLFYEYHQEEGLALLESFQRDNVHPYYQGLAKVVAQKKVRCLINNSIDSQLQQALSAGENTAKDKIPQVFHPHGSITQSKELKESLAYKEKNYLALTRPTENLFFHLLHSEVDTVIIAGLEPEDFCWKALLGHIIKFAKAGKKIFWVKNETLPDSSSLEQIHSYLKKIGSFQLLPGTFSQVLSTLTSEDSWQEEIQSVSLLPAKEWLEEYFDQPDFLEFGAHLLNYVVSRSHAQKIFQHLFEIYQKQQNHSRCARVCRVIGNILFEQGCHLDSQKKHHEAIDFWKKAKDNKSLAEEHKILGNNCLQSAGADKAVHNYGEALSLYRELEDYQGVGEITYRLALICDADEDYDLAHRYYLESLLAKRQQQDYQGQVNNLLNLSATLIKEQNWDKAKKYLQEAEEISQNHPEVFNREEIDQYLGLVYMNTQDYQSARDHYEKAYRFYKEQQEELALTFVYCNLGRVCARLEDYDAALEYYEGALENYEKMSDWHHLAAVYNNLGSINFTKKEYSLAEKCFGRAADIFEALQDVHNLIRAHHNLARVYTMQGEVENAMECYKANIEMLSQLEEKEELASTLVAYAMALLHCKNYKEAIQSLLIAVEIYDALDLNEEKEDAMQIINTIENKVVPE